MVNSKGPIVWVVEDDRSTQRLVAERLRKNNYSPILFDSAEKAYAALQYQILPALIILDMLLPGMSGVDLIRLIKQNKEWSKIPIVVVTVLSRRDSPSAEGQEGAGNTAYWINKPFDADNLMHTIERIMTSVR